MSKIQSIPKEKGYTFGVSNNNWSPTHVVVKIQPNSHLDIVDGKIICPKEGVTKVKDKKGEDIKASEILDTLKTQHKVIVNNDSSKKRLLGKVWEVVGESNEKKESDDSNNG